MSDAARLRSAVPAVTSWVFQSAAALLGNSDGLAVDPQITDGVIVLLVRVPPAGRGRLIGRQGKTVESLERIAQAIAGRVGAERPVTIKVIGVSTEVSS